MFCWIFCQTKILAGFVWISNHIANQVAIKCPLLQVAYDVIKAMSFNDFVQKLHLSFTHDIMKYDNGQILQIFKFLPGILLNNQSYLFSIIKGHFLIYSLIEVSDKKSCKTNFSYFCNILKKYFIQNFWKSTPTMTFAKLVIL